MVKYEENLPLTAEELARIRELLKEMRLDDYEIHKHYFRDKLTGVVGTEPRHGISLQELKDICSKPEKVKRGFKRRGLKGYKYTLCYEESRNVHVRIGFFFDEKPVKIFQAIRVKRNIEKAIARRYAISI